MFWVKYFSVKLFFNIWLEKYFACQIFFNDGEGGDDSKMIIHISRGGDGAGEITILKEEVR